MLPSVAKLKPEEREGLRLAQLLRGLRTLASKTDDEEIGRLNKYVRMATQGDALRIEAGSLHIELLKALTVADFRLGKAYNLGRALFEVTRELQRDDVGACQELLERHLSDESLTKLIVWCVDLKSVLPEHAGQAVADSLERWRSWARQKPWEDMEFADFTRRLRRQGERWRAILTGEKEARDLLTIATYIEAGEQLVSDAAKVAFGFAKRFWALTVLTAVLLVGGLAVVFFGSGSAVIGGLASIATALGISWKTTSSTLSKLSEKLSPPLWGAELDTAIAIAVTDPLVPETFVGPPSAGQPVPVRRATDARTTRKTARQVWKRLDRATRTQAASGRKPLRRAAYRYAGLWHGGAKTPFLPHDVYLSHVQSALEARLASKELEASERSRDELFAQFGPNDWEWIKTVVQGGLTLFEGKHRFGVEPCEQRIDDRVRIVLFSDWATGTRRARALARQIREVLESPDAPKERHLVHLGDVYYCGEADEYRRRFLRYWPAPDGVTSWNLNGNHDMYSGGHGYFGLISGDAGAGSDGDAGGWRLPIKKAPASFVFSTTTGKLSALTAPTWTTILTSDSCRCSSGGFGPPRVTARAWTASIADNIAQPPPTGQRSRAGQHRARD